MRWREVDYNDSVQGLTKAWTVSSQIIASGGLGAALYVGLGVLGYLIPYLASETLLIALAIVPLVGIRCGAIAGFCTGAVGNAVLFQFNNIRLLESWNWVLALGLVGLIAGLIGSYLLEHTSSSRRLIRVGFSAMFAVIVGLAFSATDILMGSSFALWLSAAYLPVVLNAELAVLLLVPILDLAWQTSLENAEARQ